LQERADAAWERAGIERITLQDCRHSAVSWLAAAGVPPKDASVLTGHSVPERQPGAAALTLSRYTHSLPGYVERARDLLDAFLAESVDVEAVAR
jgi:hypothetical protein